MALRKFWWVLAALLVLAGCGRTPRQDVRQPVSRPTATARAPKNSGLRFRLSPANAASDAAQGLPLAKVTPLTPEEIQTLASRLPALQSRSGDKQDFALREASRPAPRTAKPIAQPFPPPDTRTGPPAVPKDQPLEVTNIAPRGDVEMAPHLTVMFNQPMVPITTVESLADKDVPVKLTPQPAGKWRWLGTQTLMFVPDIRFPMATEYSVEVTDKRLGKAVTEKFRTPPPQLTQSYPTSGPQRLRPLIFVAFNQDVDPQVVAKHTRLSTAGAPTLRPATQAEVLADDTLASLSDSAGNDRWAAFVPTQHLKPGHSYTVEVAAGMTSKEGPLPTKTAQSFSFSTYQPLRIDWKSDDARPGESWGIGFNNELDKAKFQPASVKVSPELPGLKVSMQGSNISIRGRSKGRTAYKVTVSDLHDVYGQRLQRPETFTVKVGSASPQFSVDAQQFTVLDPSGRRELTCRVTNYPRLKVQAWKVNLEDWDAHLKVLREVGDNPLLRTQPPGEKLLDTVVETRAPQDQETEVPVDLSRVFGGKPGHAFVRVEPDPQPGTLLGWQREQFVGWVQSTRIGLDAAVGGQELVAWASDLSSGTPLAGVEVSLWPGDVRKTTDAQGLATLGLPGQGRLLVARKGDDVAILPRDASYYWSSDTYSATAGADATLWHVLDDRKLYRPGEKVSIKGWVRLNQWGTRGDLLATPLKELNYRLIDSQGNEISKGKARVGGLGGFHLNLALPKTMNLGHAQVVLNGENASHVHTFRVEEFRRPEFEVTLEASPSSSQVGSSTVLSATAAYFSGGPLANAGVHWDVSSTPTTFSPPGWDDYSFGKWTPWWNYRRWWHNEGGRGREELASNHTTQETKTDSKGKTGLKAEFLSVDPSQPHTLTAQATVQDVNRQTWTSSTSVLVHPASLYVGLKSNRTFVQKGQPLELSVIVTDLEGKAVPNKPVEVRAFRLDYEDFEEKHVDEVVRSLTSSTQGVPLKIPVGEGGTYEIQALVLDEGNRSNSSELTLWVAGGKQPPSRGVEQEAVTLVPSKKEYSPGETAEILVQTPFSPAELLVTTRRNGLANVERVRAADGSATLKVPLEELHIPGLIVQVDAVGRKVRTDAEGEELPGKPMRPAYASGTLTLNVSAASRKLDVRVTPTHPKVEPGASTSLQVEVKDAQGKPASGEVTLMMVDESVLALTGYDPADPLATFTPMRSGDAYDVHLRQYLMLRKVEPERQQLARGDMRTKSSFADDGAPSGGGAAPPAPSAAAPQSEMKEESNAPYDADRAQNRREAMKDGNTTPPPQLNVRTNFAALAVFEPALQLDAQGRATVNVKLPDSLTRYRVIALAASGVKNFGKGESSVVARQPLMIRPSAPRFLNFGDHFQLPVMVQNQTDKPMTVSIVCRGSNAVVGATDKAGYKLDVPANDRLEVRFPCAADQAGTARFQFGASAGKDGDAAEISLPVWTPATTEAFATYGVLDEGAVSQPLEKPRDVWEQFGGLSVTTTSTALSELTDAFLYLASYPFECSEQVSSRMLAAAALKDVLQAFDAPGMSTPAQLQAAMERDLEKLRGQQNDDGGWDYWVRNEPSVPYLSVHVAHTLVRVQAKGYKVHEEMLNRALAFVAEVEAHFTHDYTEETRRTIRAYALYVMNLAGKPQFDKARALCDEVAIGKHNFETLGWLLPTLAADPAGKSRSAEILRHLDNHSTQTAATAQFNSGGYADKGYLVLYSDRRDDGLLLESLITVNPKHPLIPKLVRGLLDHRVAGRWENTQENCWVLLALDKYFHQYESVTPNFIAELWLGDRFAGSQQFRGRDKNERQLDVPLKDIAGPLVLAKNGPGRLYYRIGLKYAPKDLKQPPADYGFNVQRVYEAVGDNRDVRKDADGTWRIKAGSEVKVTVTMHAPSRRYHVALVDPLPAGLEAINPALLGSKTPPPSNRYDGWWSSYWYNHQNLRDERAEAFTQLLWEGVYTYSYTARATTPGTFVVPPAKAEEMYHPETFGRSGSDKVIVE
jgi:alpha-2-macroglobulin